MLFKNKRTRYFIDISRPRRADLTHTARRRLCVICASIGTVRDVGKGKHAKRTTTFRKSVIIAGAVTILVAVLVQAAYLIPPTASVDEYWLAEYWMNDAQRGPLFAWFQWALTPVHFVLIEVGLHPAWW